MITMYSVVMGGTVLFTPDILGTEEFSLATLSLFIRNVLQEFVPLCSNAKVHSFEGGIPTGMSLAYLSDLY
jgi:hypothetical protein